MRGQETSGLRGNPGTKFMRCLVRAWFFQEKSKKISKNWNFSRFLLRGAHFWDLLRFIEIWWDFLRFFEIFWDFLRKCFIPMSPQACCLRAYDSLNPWRPSVIILDARSLEKPRPKIDNPNIASRAGGDIPAYCPIAKQEGDMQYIARTQWGRYIWYT